MDAGASSKGKAGRGRRAGGNPVSRTSELARKRERRSSRFRLIAFFGIILVLALVAGYHFWLRDSSLVGIKNLEIVGVSVKDEEGKQIDQAVRTAMGEMTTLNVQPELLREELGRYPRVADASIETSFPDSATVTVTMREDGSIYGEGSDALLIATDGTVLGPAAGEEESLPLIGDGDPPVETGAGKEPGSGGEALTGRALRQAVVLGAAPPAFRSFVKGSRMTPEGVLVEIENGPTLLFGDPSDADQKWRTASALIADPSFDTSSYVDLTVPRRPAVSPVVPTFESPEAPATGASGAAAAG